MKNVVSFMLGMAASIVVIKLATKDDRHFGDYYDDFYDFIEDDEMLYRQPKKAVKKPPTKAQQRKALLAEQDYWLAQLSDAISTQNKADKAQANENLQRIVSELEAL